MPPHARVRPDDYKHIEIKLGEYVPEISLSALRDIVQCLDLAGRELASHSLSLSLDLPL